MKYLLYQLFIISSLFIFISCEPKEERFTGSPEGKLVFENVTAIVSTTNTFALQTQEIDFTATLPQGFRSLVSGKVTIEATTTTISGSVRKASVDVLPGQNSATGKIVVGGGGGTFDSIYTLKLTAINLENPVLGKQYTLDSNVLTIGFGGSTRIPDEDSKTLLVRIVWENKVTPNQLNCYVTVPSGNEFLISSATTFREYSIAKFAKKTSTGNIIPQNAAYAFSSGDYVFSINANTIETTPIDLKYRAILRFPDGSVKVFNGLYNNLTLTSSKKQILKFTKTGIDDTSDYVNFLNF